MAFVGRERPPLPLASVDQVAGAALEPGSPVPASHSSHLDLRCTSAGKVCAVMLRSVRRLNEINSRRCLLQAHSGQALHFMNLSLLA
jgi:hypothetical protein